MAQQRGRAGTISGPHSVSLKVLRLSRPSLASQTTLPQTSFGHGLDISPLASRAHPSADPESTFPLTQLLTLPAAFGAAYVGETFTCTLCANNEVPRESSTVVRNVKIEAVLQSSSHQEGLALSLESAGEDKDKHEAGDLEPGATIQRTLRHELKDEGPHVLAVTVTYTEDRPGSTANAKLRTFRKLYQFVSQQLVAVRSKITQRQKRGSEDVREWILEAQLENVGETSVVVEQVLLTDREGVASTPVNGDENKDAVILKPQDVEQVMFLVAESRPPSDLTLRVPLGQLKVHWRSAMGERGSLMTGWLASRGR